AWCVFVADNAVRVSDIEIPLMKRQTERLEHFTCRCCTASGAWASTAAPRAPLGRGRTLRIGESFVRYSVLIGIAQNHDGILRRLRYEQVAVRRKFHQSRAGNVVGV